jgi:hypothetical protein
MLWETKDLAESEFLQGKETKESILRRVRLEAFPNGLSLPV